MASTTCWPVRKDAQVAGDGVAKPLEVADQKGLVEAELAADFLHRALGGVGAGGNDDFGRVPGEKVKQYVHQEADAEQHAGQVGQSHGGDAQFWRHGSSELVDGMQ